tara:strand:+ start:5568 stop:6302 length:735 start_codon:yes stop_codon:yes gene_type:complete
MKRSELKEMIKQAMLGEDARTDAEQEGYEDGFKDAKDDIKDKLKDMKVSEADLDEEMGDAAHMQAKTMIKAVLMDIGVDLDNPMSTNNAIYSDGVDDIIAMLRDGRDMEAEQHAGAVADQIYNKISLEEAEEDESEEEISVEDELEVEAAPEVSGGTAEVQDHLEAALEAAIAMGDDKLATQIKNTQIYLTRSQTVSEEEEMEESLASKVQRAHASEKDKEEKEVSEEDLYENRRMLKIAGIIK